MGICVRACVWKVKYGVSLFYPDSVPTFDRIIMSAKLHRWSVAHKQWESKCQTQKCEQSDCLTFTVISILPVLPVCMYNPSAVFGGGVSKRSFIMFEQSSINALKFCHSTVSYRLCELYLHARGKDMLKNLHPGKNIINFYDTEAWVQWNHYKSPIILNQKTAPCLHQMTPSGVCVRTEQSLGNTRKDQEPETWGFFPFLF